MGVTPEEVLQVKLFPIPKNKFGDLNLSDNYQCVAVSSCFAKMVESIVLEILKGKIFISDHQFGFRERHSTDVCCDVLKKVVSHYPNNNSYVFLTFLDMSRAFDYINYWKLFLRLLNEDVDVYLVRLLATWYSSEKMCICWNNVCSESIGRSNGVQQGSLLSPFLYSYYVNGMINTISMLGKGCKFKGVWINILAYADDMVLLTPSWSAMQDLLCQIEGLATDIDMVSNVGKTKCMIVKPKKSS